MPERRRLLGQLVLGVLRSGFRDPRQICTAPRDLSGAPLVQLLKTLDDEGLVRVDWHNSAVKAGDVIGALTDYGDEVYRRGYL